MDLVRTKAELKDDEGFKAFLYDDETDKSVHADVGKITGGWGRNFEAKPITPRVAEVMLDEDVEEAQTGITKQLGFFNHLDEVRQYILISIAFECGVHGLLGFREMIIALNDKDYQRAAKEIVDSALPDRRKSKLSSMMLSGQWSKVNSQNDIGEKL